MFDVEFGDLATLLVFFLMVDFDDVLYDLICSATLLSEKNVIGGIPAFPAGVAVVGSIDSGEDILVSFHSRLA